MPPRLRGAPRRVVRRVQHREAAAVLPYRSHVSPEVAGRGLGTACAAEGKPGSQRAIGRPRAPGDPLCGLRTGTVQHIPEASTSWTRVLFTKRTGRGQGSARPHAGIPPGGHVPAERPRSCDRHPHRPASRRLRPKLPAVWTVTGSEASFPAELDRERHPWLGHLPGAGSPSLPVPGGTPQGRKQTTRVHYRLLPVSPGHRPSVSSASLGTPVTHQWPGSRAVGSLRRAAARWGQGMPSSWTLPCLRAHCQPGPCTRTAGTAGAAAPLPSRTLLTRPAVTPSGQATPTVLASRRARRPVTPSHIPAEDTRAPALGTRRDRCPGARGGQCAHGQACGSEVGAGWHRTDGRPGRTQGPQSCAGTGSVRPQGCCGPGPPTSISSRSPDDARAS